MGLFTFLSRFIVEHGSSEIQMKHIAFLKEQFSLCATEKEALNTTNQKLQAEIVDLRLKIDECEKTNKQFQEKISDKSKSKIGSPQVFTPNDPDIEKIKGR